jgi:segregation and condensation protein A
LIAGLEMARGGGIELQQEAAFGPIMIRRRAEEEVSDGRTG